MRSRSYLALALTLGFSFACKKKEVVPETIDSFPVRTAKAAVTSLEETITLTGTVKARDEATLYSRVPGKLLRYAVREGDRIAKGATVALVERDEVGVKFEPAPVPSTLTGVIGRVFLDRGADVTLTTPIASIVDRSQMAVEAQLPERYVGKVKNGQEVKLSNDGDANEKKIAARITRLSPVVDQTTRTTYLEATLNQNTSQLNPGMFTRLEIVVAKQTNVIAIPVEAVVENKIFVVEGGKAFSRIVESGLRANALVEIRKGLKEGDEVITFGSFGLKDGSPVEVLQ